MVVGGKEEKKEVAVLLLGRKRYRVLFEACVGVKSLSPPRMVRGGASSFTESFIQRQPRRSLPAP